VGLSGVSVITPASHDTASAIAAVPFRYPGSAYISSGTWSLVGMEVPRPVIDERAFSANLTNEAGAGGTFQLMSNGTGLWLLQECRRTWDLHGQGWEFTELVAMAESAPALGALVDPNDPVFLAPGDMDRRIADWCQQSGQRAPDGPAAMVRCVLESLALAYRQTIELLTSTCGTSPPAVHIVGGGARNELLCQLTADATGLPVWAGPAEASEVGNLLVQAMALGELSSLADARAVVAESFSPVLYEPRQRGRWDDAYDRFKRLSQGRPGR
jgi:rhamnulokinase